MEKIDVAELLKDCPKGMELDCALYDDVTLSEVSDNRDNKFPIKIAIGANRYRHLTKTGGNDIIPESKCVIYPKGKTTWEGFVPPCKFKDGDVLSYQCGGLKNRTIYIYRYHKILNTTYYVALSGDTDSTFRVNYIGRCALNGYNGTVRPATEEEKERLFKAIKENGYKWNTETKTLEKLVEPEFNVGDWIIRNNKYTGIPVKVVEFNGYYSCELNGEVVSLTRNDVHNNFHLWTIDDAKDGDVVCYKDEISLYKHDIKNCTKQETTFGGFVYRCCYDGKRFIMDSLYSLTEQGKINIHPATKEQRDLLFQKMREAGYRWVAETKTLEKLVILKFKVGDKVRNKNNHNVVFTITGIGEDSYVCGASLALWFDDQDKYELVPNKFDITTLKPFNKVLTRDNGSQKWDANLFSFYDNESGDYRFQLVGVVCARYCIPFVGNEHLLGTTDDCDEFYKTWTNEEDWLN